MELLIHNARVADGTGAPWFVGHVGVTRGRIVCVKPGKPDPLTADRIVDAQGLCLAPGFIDCHTHLDLALLDDPVCADKLRQGVTSVVVGACGFSAAPVSREYKALLEHNLAFIAAGVTPDWTWCSFGQWLERLERLPLGPNVASQVGHGTLRTAVMGFADRAPTPAELHAMEALLEDALDAGACGMSSGLVYTPGIFSVPEELEALTRVLARRGRLYETHMRNESDFVQDCVQENIELARRTGAMVHISHLKASGQRNFGKSAAFLQAINAARAEGLDVTFNQHPYRIGSTTLRAILPGWAQEGGFEALCARLRDTATRARIRNEVAADMSDWDNYYRNSGGANGVLLLNTPAAPELEGRTLTEAAAARRVDPLELAFDLITTNHGEDAAAFDNMDEADIERIMRHPAGILASDSIPGAPGTGTHPRLCGAFARVLDYYVRQRKVISVEEAVRRMTFAPARRYGLTGRGILLPGCHADLVLFDPEGVRDNATFAQPHAAPDGVALVVVNGRVCVESSVKSGVIQGTVQTSGAGKVLRAG